MPSPSPAGVFLGTVDKVGAVNAATGQPSRAWVIVPDLTGRDYAHGGDTGVPVADLPPTFVDHPGAGGRTSSGFPALARGDRVLVGLQGGRADRVIVLARLARA